MKKIIRSIVFAAAAVTALASCTDHGFLPGSEVNKLHFRVIARQSTDAEPGAEENATRTYLTYNSVAGTYTPYWKNGDELGAFLGSTSITGSTAAVDMTLTNNAADGTTGDFEGTAVASGSGTFLAFYPASAFEKGYADGGIGLNIGSTTDYIQHPSVSSPDPTCDILVSKSCDYISDGADVVIDNLYFARPLSILKINLKGTYAAGEEVSWLKFAVSSGTLSGRVDIDLSTLDINSWPVPKKYVWAAYSSSKPVINHATDNTVYLVVNPTTLTTGTTVTVTGETAHVVIEKTFTLTGDMTFPTGGIAVLNLTVNAADCSLKASENYTLVTTSGAFEAGSKYVLAFKDGSDNHYEFIKNGTNSSNIESGALTVSAGVISSPSSTYVFTAETGVASGSFKLKNSADNYICNTSSSTVNTNNATGSDWIPTFLSASSTYKLTASDTERNLSSGGSTSAKAYIDDNFKDQVDEGIAIAQYAGAISVFKYTDGRSALSTPTGLSVSEMTVSWTAVANAGSYIVTINGTDYKVATNSYTYTGDAGYYDVEVVAVPTIAGVDTYKNSAAATLDDATFGTPTLATPVLASGGITATSVTVTWTDDPNAANGYHCEIYNGLSKVDEDEVALGTHSVTFSGLTKGTEYTVKVNGKAVTGSKPWVASGVASIILTPDGQTVSSITSAASYNIPDLTVMAVNGGNVILADATGAVLLYKTSHGLSIGDVRTVNGYTKTYHGVYEFYTDGSHALSITGTGTTTPDYPSPVNYDASKITAYASAPVTEYATATGTADSGAKTVTVATGKVLNVFGDLSSVDGKQVIVNGYACGYNSSKVDFIMVGTPTLDPSVPALTTDPASGSTLEWDDDKYGAGNSKTISVTLNGAATGYTVSYTDSESEWTVSDDGAGTITAYPKAANGSTTTDKTLAITITHNDNGLLTSTITLKQKKQGVVVSSYTFTTKSWGDSSSAWTSGSDGNGYTSGQGIQVTTAGANATSKSSFTNVSRVVVTYNTNKTAGAGSIKIKIGTNSEVSNSVAYSGSGDGRSANYTTTFNFATPQTGAIKITVATTTNSIWVKSIDITHE